MDIQTLPHALEDIVQRNPDVELSHFESGAGMHPSWATPVAALARAAESRQDWTAAYELWTHARLLIPQSDTVKNGIARAAVHLMRSKLPGNVAADVGLPSEVSEERRSADGPSLETTSSESAQSDATIDAPAEGGLETTLPPGPAPLVQPFEIDLTEFDVDSQISEVELPTATPATGQDAMSTGSTSDVALDELDQLIGRLEGARIVPREDADAVPTPDLKDDIGDIASETLAKIYLDQEQYDEAAAVFDRLAEQNPDRADEFFAHAADARSRSSS